MGVIRGPGRKPFRSQNVTLLVGGVERRVRAFGPRLWRRTGDGMAASEPTEVDGIQMEWPRAYGGSHRRPAGIMRGVGLPGPSFDDIWASNPQGIGFYTVEEEADGCPLPQIEDPEHLVAHWDDRPTPQCWGRLPVNSSLRFPPVDRTRPPPSMQEVRRAIYRLANVEAPPWLRFEHASAGDQIEVRGFDENTMRFAIPSAPFGWRVDVGDESSIVHPRIWSLHLRPNNGSVTAFYRTRMEIPLVRRLTRTVRQIRLADEGAQ